jgi:hypothetical protein
MADEVVGLFQNCSGQCFQPSKIFCILTLTVVQLTRLWPPFALIFSLFVYNTEQSAETFPAGLLQLSLSLTVLLLLARSDSPANPGRELLVIHSVLIFRSIIPSTSSQSHPEVHTAELTSAFLPESVPAVGIKVQKAGLIDPPSCTMHTAFNPT